MNIYGFDSIAGLLDNTGYLFKLIANERGVVLFPHTTEHRDGAQPGCDSPGLADTGGDTQR
jgi:hypothetical protein